MRLDGLLLRRRWLWLVEASEPGGILLEFCAHDAQCTFCSRKLFFLTESPWNQNSSSQQASVGGGRSLPCDRRRGRFGRAKVVSEVASHVRPRRLPRASAGTIVRQSVAARVAHCGASRPRGRPFRGRVQLDGRAETCEASVVLEIVDAGGEVSDQRVSSDHLGVGEPEAAIPHMGSDSRTRTSRVRASSSSDNPIISAAGCEDE